MKILIWLIVLTQFAKASDKHCYQVEGMVCGSCVKKIEAHFKKNKEIQKTTVSLINERAELIFKKKGDDKVVQKEFKKLNFKAEPISCD